MCWETDRVTKTGYNVNGGNKILGGCYDSKCDFNAKSISLKYKNKWYTCESGATQISTSDGGTFTCPHYGRFCLGVN